LDRGRDGWRGISCAEAGPLRLLETTAFSWAIRKRCWEKLAQKWSVWPAHDLNLLRSCPISCAKQDQWVKINVGGAFDS
jgi:hypothetical protein